MRKLKLILVLLCIPAAIIAQRQAEYPRLKLTWDGSTSIESADTDGFWVWRTSSVTPALSAAGTARLYFNGTKLQVSENGGAYTAVSSGIPATATANFLFAGPTSGGAAAPAFRAMVLADIPDSLITFAKWASNSCTANQIPKRNAGNTAWVCAADDTSVGGTSWVTNGNAVGAGTAVIGSTDAFDWNLIRGGTNQLTVGSGILDTTGLFRSSRSGTNVIGFHSNTTSVGAQFGYLLFDNRTTTLPTVGATQSAIIMDNGALKYNSAGAGWVPLGGTTVKSIQTFRPSEAEQPTTNFAAFNTRNQHPVLNYDAATRETVYFSGVMPDWYDGTSGVSVVIHWTAATATSLNTIWAVAIENMSGTTQDIDADGFGTEVTGASTAQTTSGVVRVATLNLTNAQADALGAGDSFRIRVARDAANGSDNMTGDAQITVVHFKVQ